MHKINLIAALMLATAPLAANAEDGKIKFQGKVTDKTCTISTPGGKNFTVFLPTVSKNTLSTAGAVAGRTPFAINLTKCSAGKVATYFQPGSSVDFDTGRLINEAKKDAATKVQLQLRGSNNNFLSVKSIDSGDSTQTNSQWVTVGKDGSADMNYYVEYYATGKATPGDVTSSIKYTIIYN